jgi:phosphate transport system substrate-binding protein
MPDRRQGNRMRKSNRGYIAAAIASQMVIVPIVLTVGLFIVSSILEQVLNTSIKSQLGTGMVRFIYILIAFFGALLAGGVVGYIFSIVSKQKPDTAKARYLAPLIPILYALVFAMLASIFSKGNFNSGWWGIYFFKNPVFFIFDLALTFSGLHFIMPVAELAGYAGFVAGILLYELVSRTAVKNKTAGCLKAVFAALFAVCIVYTWIGTGDVVNNGVIELQYGKSTIGNDLTEFDLMQIAPFKENNGLARFDGKASLQFTALDEMPRLDGATAAYPVYAAFVEAVYKGLGEYYEANRNKNDKDTFAAFVSSSEYPLDIVKCSKTGDAYERLINSQTDIIFVAEPSKAQVDRIKAKGDEFVLTPIGFEAFVFFTNKQNSVENLTIQQIQGIYSGSITNWKEVGGENRSILPYQRPEDSGSQTIMQNKVMKGINMLAPSKETHAGGMGEVISKVAGYQNARNAIGYSFMYYSSSMIKNNQIKYIAVEGVKPAPETVRNKSYPFTVPVFAVTLKSNTGKNVGKFIDWIVSEEGQSLVEKTGYVPVK